jgi:hypothetical protein
MVEKVLTFHGDPAIKDRYVARMKAHIAADELIHGKFWENGKGCHVGCLVETSVHPHGKLSAQIGIPLELSYLIDRLFEGQPGLPAKEFASSFIETVPVGVDLTPVVDQFLLTLLKDPEHGAIRHTNERTRPKVQAVIEMYERRIAGSNPTIAEWRAAAAAAYAAADAAAAAYAAVAAYADAYADAYAAAAAAAAADADADAAVAAYADAYADAYAAAAAAAAAYAYAAAAADAAAYAYAAAAAAAAADAYYSSAAKARSDSYIWQAQLLLSLIAATAPAAQEVAHV